MATAKVVTGGVAVSGGAGRSRGRAAMPLSRRLRKETKVIHRVVEAGRLARAFFGGRLTAEVYAEGLARLLPVYEAMEGAIASAGPSSALAEFRLPQMYRAAAIEDDLRYFGCSAEGLASRSPASAAYGDRVRSLAASEAQHPLLVAHAYVRYMADVSGGLIAGRVAQRVLKLPTREGLAFLSFPQVADPAAFRDDFRARLDRLPFDAATADLVVAEAGRAFEYNHALAEELFGELGEGGPRP